MATVRRMGDPDSATAHAIMDGAERVLQDRGYGAITSRSVAEEAGVKHQLVYYYFQDTDALLLAACRRRMDSGIARLHEDAKSDRPIRAIWEDFTHAISAWLDFEYMALANHHEGVRQVLVRFLAEARRARRFSAIELEGLDRAAASELLGERGLAVEGRDLDALLERTAGNPLFIESLADPADAGALADARNVPESVRDLFDQRFRLVDDRTAAVAIAAAVIGQRVDIERFRIGHLDAVLNVEEISRHRTAENPGRDCRSSLSSTATKNHRVRERNVAKPARRPW